MDGSVVRPAECGPQPFIKLVKREGQRTYNNYSISHKSTLIVNLYTFQYTFRFLFYYYMMAG